VFRRWAERRYRLLPYIWSEAVRCAAASQPVVRPLVLDWQDDPTTFGIGSQFMLGEHLMLAPILSRSSRRRAYLPEGRWVDYPSGRMRDGPAWVQLDAGLDGLPMFLRADAIVPTADVAQHTAALDWDRLTIDVFPVGSSRFVLTRDQLEQVEISCERSGKHVRVGLETAVGPHRLRLRGVRPPRRVTVDGRPARYRLSGGDLLVVPDRPFRQCVIEEA
jgi:alpha-D-xyloside xylohydrolase